MACVCEFRACLKNHSRNLHVPLCGRFHPNSVAVARYGALIRAKSPTNCDAHLAESIFQTRSRPRYARLFLCGEGGRLGGAVCCGQRQKTGFYSVVDCRFHKQTRPCWAQTVFMEPALYS
ncbi:MAG: DUF6783 domain-containing protein [Ruminococcus sp.]